MAIGCAATTSTAMCEMPMPGGWTMSMVWMRMPGQTWPSATGSFLAMWVVMMVAMMLPSVAPMLRDYRRSVTSTNEIRRGLLTALVGVGYFMVWTVAGLVAYQFGVAVAAFEMHQPSVSRAAPFAAAAVVVIAGACQFTGWKLRHLTCCRDAAARGPTMPADAGMAWRHGVRLGLYCVACCANLMTILLVVGIMDVRVMAAVTAAITAERLGPVGDRVARAIGAVVIGAGLLMIARTAALG